MTLFTVVDSSTGRVIYGGVAADPSSLVIAGQTVITGQQQSSGYFQDGVHHGEGMAPSSNHIFDYSTKQWVDLRSLSDLKIAVWTSIKASRDAAISAPLSTPYGIFDCKPKDRTNITDAVLLLQTLASVGTPTTIEFTLANNTTVTLTTAEMVTVGLLLGQKVQAAHAQARNLRAQIDAANSSTELEAIVWV